MLAETAGWYEKAAATGKAEGRTETLIKVLPGLLEKRFGPQSESIHRQVTDLTETEHEEAIGSILSANSVAEVSGMPDM